jgi:hypothetical protein
VHECRHRHARRRRPPSHRQLVAEESRLRLTHSGQSQVLTQRCCLLEIEVIEWYDAIDSTGASDMADAEQHVLGIPLLADVRHVEDFVDAFARPLGAFKTFRGNEQHAAPLPPQLAQELESFVIARQAKNGEWCRHEGKS